jgi:hypothetical protein
MAAVHCRSGEFGEFFYGVFLQVCFLRRVDRPSMDEVNLCCRGREDVLVDIDRRPVDNVWTHLYFGILVSPTLLNFSKKIFNPS